MSDKNFVIALTRTCGSGATSIGQILAKDYDIDLYDKNILRMASDASGINEDLFYKADETAKKGLLYSVSKKVYNGKVVMPESPDFTKNDNLFAYQAKVLKELAEKESYVCIGRGADYILKEFPRVVRVFVLAPLEKCIESEMERLSMTRKEAEKRIMTEDKRRGEYYKYHTGKVWENPYNYDLCLNTGEITYEQGAQLIEEYIRIKYGIDVKQ